MRRHLAGIIAGALTASASYALTAGVRDALDLTPSSRPEVRACAPDLAPRRFSGVALAWSGVRTSPEIEPRGLVGSACEMHECSDGTRVFDARFRYASPEFARAAYGELDASAGDTTQACAREAGDGACSFACGRRAAWLIFRSDAVADAPPSPYDGDSRTARAWVDGGDLRVVFGPSPVHVDEFLAGRD